MRLIQAHSYEGEPLVYVYEHGQGEWVHYTVEDLTQYNYTDVVTYDNKQQALDAAQSIFNKAIETG